MTRYATYLYIFPFTRPQCSSRTTETSEWIFANSNTTKKTLFSAFRKLNKAKKNSSILRCMCEVFKDWSNETRTHNHHGPWGSKCERETERMKSGLILVFRLWLFPGNCLLFVSVFASFSVHQRNSGPYLPWSECVNVVWKTGTFRLWLKSFRSLDWSTTRNEHLPVPKIASVAKQLEKELTNYYKIVSFFCCVCFRVLGNHFDLHRAE